MLKTYTYNLQFHNNTQATFCVHIQTKETEVNKVLKLLKDEMRKRYEDIFVLNQDISYAEAVNENGEIIFKWEK